MKAKRWIISKLRSFNDSLTAFIAEHDQCEICREIEADVTCVACGRRVCYECDSGYYSDENLCVGCESGTTTAQRAAGVD